METVLRVVFMYVFVWLCLRILGKRELTQMSPFELVTLLFIPQLFSRALTRADYSMTNAVIGSTTLFVLVFLTSAATYRHKRLAWIAQSSPTVLVRHGELIEAHLNQERIAPEDIFSVMHKVGLQRLDQVEWAILEGDGKIAIVPMSVAAPNEERANEARRQAAGALSTQSPLDMR